MDEGLSRLVSLALQAAPHTAVFLLGDAPGGEAADTAALHVLYPAAEPTAKSGEGAAAGAATTSASGTEGAAAHAARAMQSSGALALERNAAEVCSAVDLHATLRQIPLVRIAHRLPNGAPATPACSFGEAD